MPPQDAPNDLCAITRSKARGFSLVELVLVIVLLGLLAALALPRLTALGRDARIARVTATAEAVHTAARLGHSLWLIRGNGDWGQLTLDAGQGVQFMTWQGYPEAGDCCVGPGQRPTGIEALIDGEGYTLAFPDNRLTRFEVQGAPDPASCSVTYTEANGPNDPYRVSSTTAGC